MEETTLMKLATLAATFLLAVPAFAGIAGRWDVTSTTNDGEKIKSVMTVAEASGKVDVTLAIGEQKIPLESITYVADQLSFRLNWAGTGVTIKAKLDGDTLAGKWTADSGETGPVTAARIAEAFPASSPSFFAGKWKVTVTMPERDPYKVEMEVKDADAKLSATIVTPDGMAIPGAAVADGEKLTVTVDTGSATYTLKFARDGEGLKGTVTSPGGEAPMTATR